MTGKEHTCPASKPWGCPRWLLSQRLSRHTEQSSFLCWDFAWLHPVFASVSLETQLPATLAQISSLAQEIISYGTTRCVFERWQPNLILSRFQSKEAFSYHKLCADSEVRGLGDSATGTPALSKWTGWGEPGRRWTAVEEAAGWTGGHAHRLLLLVYNIWKRPVQENWVKFKKWIISMF